MLGSSFVWGWFRRSNLSGARCRRKTARYVPVLDNLEDRRLLSFNFFPGNGADIALGPDGNLWFTEPNRIGRITPDGTVTHYAVPTPPRFGFGGITAGPDGNVWFTEIEGTVDQPSFVGRITPDGTVTEFSNLRVNSYPGGIATGPDGNLWFSDTNNFGNPVHEMERITPDGAVTEFTANATGVVTAGPDGNVWFDAAGGVGRITPDGTVTVFNLPSIPQGIGNIEGMTAGPDGSIWVVASEYPGFNVNGEIARVTPDGQITEFKLPSQSQELLGEITAGPDGNLWFVDGSKLGQITPDGNITEIAVPPTSGFSPQLNGGITAGPDGAIWFTSSNGIGQFVLDGITAVPTNTHLAAPVHAIAGQPVTFTATVTSSAGTPTGSVAFFDNGAFLGSVDLDTTGQAAFTTSLDVGFHIVSALYVGTPDFLPSGDVRGVQVDPGGTPNVQGLSAATALSGESDGRASVAAVDALFVGVPGVPPSAGPGAEPAGAAAAEAARPASQPEAVTAPPVWQAAADAGTVSRYQGDGADAAHATWLADALAAAFLEA
jgi:streptogramin lyase